jgi:hypothetical protein
MSGFVLGDIRIYKNGSITERTSTAGFTLLDTDGTDFDGLTGIHGFSIDLADNTDAGFYAVGSTYWVIVSSITVSGQTVNFIAATFRIVAAEATAGSMEVNVRAINNVSTSAVTTVKASQGLTIADTVTTATNLTTNNDKTGYAIGVGGIAATAFAADAISAGALSQAAAQEIADEVLDRNLAGGGSGNTRNVRNTLRAIRNKQQIAAGTLTVYQEDDATSAWTAAITTTAGNPISTIDPA